jgi:lysophospholipase L1-like esterase
VAGRIALVLGGLLAGLALVEVIAQTAAAWNAWGHAPTRVGAPAASRRILAVGDSNTFGARVGRDQAYPAQLSRRLPDAIVTNAGYPAMSSGRVRAALPALLAETRATEVLILVGVNDAWNAPETATARRPWWAHLRVARLAYQLWFVLHTPRVTPDNIAERRDAMLVGGAVVDVGWRWAPDPDWETHLRENLRAMAEEARRAGARPWFLSYASSLSHYGTTNRALRDMAPAVGMPLIDVGQAMVDRCGQCANQFFEDAHPNPAGYVSMAELVARALDG